MLGISGVGRERIIPKRSIRAFSIPFFFSPCGFFGSKGVLHEEKFSIRTENGMEGKINKVEGGRCEQASEQEELS